MHTQTSVRRHCLHYILFSCASGWRTAHVCNSFSLSRFVWIPVVLVPHPWNICLRLLWCKRTNCKKMAVLLTLLPPTLTLSIVAKNYQTTGRVRVPNRHHKHELQLSGTQIFTVCDLIYMLVPYCSYYMHLPLMSCST